MATTKAKKQTRKKAPKKAATKKKQETKPVAEQPQETPPVTEPENKEQNAPPVDKTNVKPQEDSEKTAPDEKTFIENNFEEMQKRAYHQNKVTVNEQCTNCGAINTSIVKNTYPTSWRKRYFCNRCGRCYVVQYGENWSKL